MATQDLLAPPTWDQIESDEEFQKLDPMKKQRVLSTWGSSVKSYAQATGQLDTVTPEELTAYREAKKAGQPYEWPGGEAPASVALSDFLSEKAKSYADQWSDGMASGTYSNSLFGEGQRLLDRINLGVQQVAPNAIALSNRAAELAVEAGSFFPKKAAEIGSQIFGVEGGERAIESAVAPVRDTFRASADAARAQANDIATAGAALGGGFLGDVAQGGGTALTEAPQQAALALATGGQSVGIPLTQAAAQTLRGINVSALYGAAQSGLATLDAAEKQYMDANPTLTREEARMMALPEAGVSAASTALVTRLGGTTGIESVLKSGGVAGLRRKTMEVLKEALSEGVEEAADQGLQDLAERWYRNPTKTWEDTNRELALAFVIGGVAGGGVSAVTQAMNSAAEQAAQAGAPQTAAVLREDSTKAAVERAVDLFGGDETAEVIARAEELLKEQEAEEGTTPAPGATEAPEPTGQAPAGNVVPPVESDLTTAVEPDPNADLLGDFGVQRQAQSEGGETTNEEERQRRPEVLTNEGAGVRPAQAPESDLTTAAEPDMTADVVQDFGVQRRPAGRPLPAVQGSPEETAVEVDDTADIRRDFNIEKPARSSVGFSGRGVISGAKLPGKVVQFTDGTSEAVPEFVLDPNTMAESLHAVAGTKRIYVPKDIVESEDEAVTDIFDSDKITLAREKETGRYYVASATHSRYPDSPIQADGKTANNRTLEDLYRADPTRVENSERQTGGSGEFTLPEEDVEFTDKVLNAPPSELETQSPEKVQRALSAIRTQAERLAEETYADVEGRSTPIGAIMATRIGDIATNVYLARLRGVTRGSVAPSTIVGDIKGKMLERLSARTGVSESLDRETDTGATVGDTVPTQATEDTEAAASDTRGEAAEEAEATREKSYTEILKETLGEVVAELSPKDQEIFAEAQKRINTPDPKAKGGHQRLTVPQKALLERVQKAAAQRLKTKLAELTPTEEDVEDGDGYSLALESQPDETQQAVEAQIERNLTDLVNIGATLDGPNDLAVMLDAIAADPGNNRLVRTMARMLLDLGHDFSKVRVEIAVSQGKVRNWAGKYEAGTTADSGVVKLNIRAKHSGGVVQTVLHEALHHVAFYKLRQGYKRNAVEQAAYDDLGKILEHLQKQVVPDGTPANKIKTEVARATKGNRALYGVTSIDEFFTEILSNPAFMQWVDKQPPLPGIKAKGGFIRNLLDQVRYLFKRFVHGKNVTPGSLLDQALDNVMKLAETPQTDAQIADFIAQVRRAKGGLETAQATNTATERFNELTADLGANPTKGDIEAWKQANPEKYAELERMKADVLRAAGYNVGPLYHGTSANFTAFRPGSYFATPESGIAEKIAGQSGKVMTVFARASKTYQSYGPVMDRSRQSLMGEGYDSAQVHPSGKPDSESEWMIFNPEQIKSADPLELDDEGNLVTPDQWGDTENPDIRYSVADDSGDPQTTQSGYTRKTTTSLSRALLGASAEARRILSQSTYISSTDKLNDSAAQNWLLGVIGQSGATLEDAALQLDNMAEDTFAPLSPIRQNLARGHIALRYGELASYLAKDIAKSGNMDQFPLLEFYRAQHVSNLRKLQEHGSVAGQNLQVFAKIARIFQPFYAAMTYTDPFSKVQKEVLDKDGVAQKVRDEVDAATKEAAEKTVAATSKITGLINRVVAKAQKAADSQAVGDVQLVFDFLFQVDRNLGGTNFPVTVDIAQTIGDSMVRHLFPKAKKTTGNAEADSFLDQLYSETRKRVQSELDLIVRQGAPEKSAEEKVREGVTKMLKDLDIISLVKKSFEDAQGKVLNNPALSEEARKALTAYRFDDTQLKGAQQVVRAGLDIKDLITKTLTERNATLEAFIETLKKNYKLNDKSAAAVGEAVRSAFVTEARNAAARRLDALTRAKVLRPKLSKSDELFKLINIGGFSDEAFYNALAKRFNLPTYNEAMVKKLQAEAERIQSLPQDSDIRNEATIRLMGEIAEGARQSLTGLPKWKYILGDMAPAVWQAAILTGPPTHIVNYLSTVANITLQSFSDAAGYGMAAYKNGASVKEVMGFYSDILTAFSQTYAKKDSVAKMEFLRALETGVTRYKNAKLEDVSLLERLSNSNNMVEKIFGNLKWVGRVMLATDAFNSGTAQEIRQRHALRYAATLEGKAGQDLEKAILDAFDPPADVLKEIDQKVAREESEGVFDGARDKDLAKRIRREELIENRRGLDILESGQAAADKWTFNGDPKGMAGYIFDGVLNGMNRKLKVTKVLLPFMRTMANLFDTSLDFTPGIGQLRAYNVRLSRVLGEDSDYAPNRIERGSPEFYSQQAKAWFGTVLFAAILGAAFKGLEDEEEGKDPFFAVYGAGPDDKFKRNALQTAGWMPNSLKIGGKYFRYTDWPAINIALSAVGALSDYARDAQNSDTPIPTKIGVALLGTTAALTEKTMLGGASNLITVLANPDQRGLNSLNRLMTSIVGGVSNPPLFQWLRNTLFANEQGQVPVLDRGGLRGTLSSITPFSIGADQALNALGEPITAYWHTATTRRFGYFNSTPEHPILTPLAKNGLFVPSPSKNSTLRVPGRAEPMTLSRAGEEVWRKYLVYRGDEIKRRLPKARVDALLRMDREEAQSVLDGPEIRGDANQIAIRRIEADIRSGRLTVP